MDKGDNVPQPDTGGYQHKDAQAEHEDDAGLGLGPHVEPQKPRERQHKDGQVLGDAERRRSEGEHVDVEAVLVPVVVQPALPRELDGLALEDLHKDEDGGRDHDEEHRRVGGVLEWLVGEDAEVEAEDAYLGQAKTEEV